MVTLTSPLSLHWPIHVCLSPTRRLTLVTFLSSSLPCCSASAAVQSGATPRAQVATGKLSHGVGVHFESFENCMILKLLASLKYLRLMRPSLDGCRN